MVAIRGHENSERKNSIKAYSPGLQLILAANWLLGHSVFGIVSCLTASGFPHSDYAK